MHIYEKKEIFYKKRITLQSYTYIDFNRLDL